MYFINTTFTLSTGPTVLISYITAMFYKITNFKTVVFFRSFTVESVSSSVHHQCKLHGENVYITHVNIVHSYNILYIYIYLDFILWLFWKKHWGTFFNSIKFKIICIALFNDTIIAKQLHRKLSF